VRGIFDREKFVVFEVKSNGREIKYLSPGRMMLLYDESWINSRK
jgi:hypothetical protein